MLYVAAHTEYPCDIQLIKIVRNGVVRLDELEADMLSEHLVVFPYRELVVVDCAP